MGNWIHYSSAHPGALVLSGTAGALTDILQACLVDGTTAQSVTSITRSGATATVTTAAHAIPTGHTAWRTISGAAESDYNGTFQVTATSSTTFTYTVANSPTTPATGTILHAIPPAGWTTVYSATNKKAFYMGAGALARKYYRVNDDAAGTAGAKEALIKGYNTMSDVDTGANPFPTAAQSALTQNSHIIRKSAAANGTARNWQLFADDRTAILFIQNGDIASNYTMTYFGEYFTRASGDTTCAMLAAKGTENNITVSAAGEVGLSYESTTNMVAGAGGYYRHTCGDSGGFNVSTPCYLAPIGFGSSTAGASQGVIPYPNPLDGGLYLVSPLLWRSVSSKPSPIGTMRGIFHINHAASNFADADYFSGSGDYAGKSFLIMKTVASALDGTNAYAVEYGSNPEFSS